MIFFLATKIMLDEGLLYYVIKMTENIAVYETGHWQQRSFFLVEIYTIRVLRNYLLHIYSLQVWINPLRKYKFKAYQFEFILWKTKLFLWQHKKDSLNMRYNSMKNAGKTLTWTQGRYLLRAILTNLYLYTLT